MKQFKKMKMHELLKHKELRELEIEGYTHRIVFMQRERKKAKERLKTVNHWIDYKIENNPTNDI